MVMTFATGISKKELHALTKIKDKLQKRFQSLEKLPELLQQSSFPKPVKMLTFTLNFMSMGLLLYNVSYQPIYKQNYHNLQEAKCTCYIMSGHCKSAMSIKTLVLNKKNALTMEKCCPRYYK